MNLTRAVIVAAVLGTALAYMSDDMLNLAVPSVARELGATVTDVQWILDAYYVALVASVLVMGAVGDRIGHRRVFLAGLAVFVGGAIGAATAPAVPWLVASRFVQGVGAAMLLASALALVTLHHPREARARAVGAFLGLVAAVPAAGPFVSGVLVDLLSWRWLFLVPLVLPLAAAVLTVRWVPETPRSARRPDLAGGALAFVALSGLSVVLIAGAGTGPPSPVPLLAASVAALAGLGFWLVERGASEPMLPWRLVKRRAFLGGNVAWLLAGLTSWGAVFFVAIALQSVLGLRPVVAGLLLTPIYLVMMVGAPIAGRAAGRVGPRRLIVVGLVVYAAGLGWLSLIGPETPIATGVVMPVLVMAAGMATITAPLASATLAAVDEADQGVASGMNNAAGQLAGLFAIAVLPWLTGVAGVGLGSPEFASGFGAALRWCAAIALATIPVVAWAFGGRQVAAAETPRVGASVG